MKTIAYTTAEELEAQAARPELEREELDKIVRIIFDEVKRKGDEAINKYTYHYDGVTLGSIVVDELIVLSNSTADDDWIVPRIRGCRCCAGCSWQC